MRVELRLFGNVAEALVVGEAVPMNGLAVKQNFPIGRIYEPGNHFYRGRFARPVRAEVARHLTLPRDKAHITDSWDSRVAFCYVPQFKHSIALLVNSSHPRVPTANQARKFSGISAVVIQFRLLSFRRGSGDV